MPESRRAARAWRNAGPPWLPPLALKGRDDHWHRPPDCARGGPCSSSRPAGRFDLLEVRRAVPQHDVGRARARAPPPPPRPPLGLQATEAASSAAFVSPMSRPARSGHHSPTMCRQCAAFRIFMWRWPMLQFCETDGAHSDAYPPSSTGMCGSTPDGVVRRGRFVSDSGCACGPRSSCRRGPCRTGPAPPRSFRADAMPARTEFSEKCLLQSPQEYLCASPIRAVPRRPESLQFFDLRPGHRGSGPVFSVAARSYADDAATARSPISCTCSYS